MEISDIYKLLPGKSGKYGKYLPLWMHLEDTAAVMEDLCNRRIPDSIRTACGMHEDSFRKVAIFLAMVHDLGKCTPLFTSRIFVSLPEQRTRLENTGLMVPALERFQSAGNSPHPFAGEVLLAGRGCPNGICSVVGAHHGKPTSSNDFANEYLQLDAYPQNYYANQKELWTSLQDELIRRALLKSGFSSLSDLPTLSNCAQMLMTGLLIQADWIASNEEYFPLLPEDTADAEMDYPARMAEAFERLDLPACWIPEPQAIYDEAYFKQRFGFMPNPMQISALNAAASMASGGLMIMEAQMGIGKTEAALAAAEILSAKTGCGGIFFGLPTQATSNGLFPRLADWAEKLSKDERHSIRLVHGMAELNDGYRQYRGQAQTDDDGQGGLIAHGWFSGRKQALLADFVVGTVDTALMAALKQKHIMLRHLGLCSKTVIIDECHAYDAYMSKYLDRMLRWFGAYQIPVILLSATLPEQRRSEMLQAYLGTRKPSALTTEGYPVITWTEGTNVKSTAVTEAFPSHNVGIVRLEEENLIQDLKERLSHGGCAGIIVNTVKRAQALYAQLRDAFPEKKVYVYHAQFLAEDRVRRENELMEIIGKHSSPDSRNNVIVVGTQVLEQSLDIDFDYLVTDLCPMDLLLQRIGRLHRHERPRPMGLTEPCCSVLCADGEFEKAATAIYHRWPLKQTRYYLPEALTLPEDIPRLVNMVYAQPKSELDDPDWTEFRNLTDIKEEKASSFLLGKPKESKRVNMNSVVGMLDLSLESDKRAEASVRDASPSVDVLVMRDLGEERAGFLPWVSDGVLRMDAVPSHEEGKAVARQRLKLPAAFCVGNRLDATINALEEENSRFFSVWQDSPWLKGELIFLLDNNGERDFGTYHVKYEQELGFTYERSENT